jgi:hypothetical protein
MAKTTTTTAYLLGDVERLCLFQQNDGARGEGLEGRLCLAVNGVGGEGRARLAGRRRRLVAKSTIRLIESLKVRVATS